MMIDWAGYWSLLHKFIVVTCRNLDSPNLESRQLGSRWTGDGRAKIWEFSYEAIL